MGGGEDETAGGQVLAHNDGELALRGGVERGRRFVEQPDRPRRDQEPGERDAALLAGGQRPRREIGDMGEAEPIERRDPRRAGGIAAERVGPEGEIFAGGERALQRVGVAEIVRLLANSGLRRPALERERPGRRAAGSRRPPSADSTCPIRWGRGAAAPCRRAPRTTPPTRSAARRVQWRSRGR